MYRLLAGTLLFALLTIPAAADDQITRAQIQQVIDATDAAARERDAAAIGVHLGESFTRAIEFPVGDMVAKARIGRMEYLQTIDLGWKDVDDYSTQRDNIQIHILPGGFSGQSYSTITEQFVVDGRKMTSRVREYAVYELEGERAVITEVSAHRLLGDTTPE
jgi:hypothetical protein